MDYTKKLESLQQHVDNTTLEFTKEQVTILKSLSLQNGSKNKQGWEVYRNLQKKFSESNHCLHAATESLAQAKRKPNKKNINNVEVALELFNNTWQSTRNLSMLGILSN